MKLKKLQNRKGFTLIELVVVIAILGILGLCAISSYGDVREKAEERAFEMTRKQLYEAAVMCSIEFPHTEIVWASHQGGELAVKNKPITEANLHEAWYLYFDEYPKNPIDENVDFTVHIYPDGEIEILPETP
jgi:prepilin-type N-terminal cleavage/methylation domain-containing protein